MALMTIRRLLFVPKTISHFTARRTYASFSNTITLEAREVLNLDPRIFSAISAISAVELTTAATWPRWNPDMKREDNPPSQRECEVELPRILRALDLAPSVTRSTIPLDNILDLPITHSKLNEFSQRTPISVFKAIGLRAHCPDIGLWTLEDFPSITVIHAPTRLALSKARLYKHISDGDGGNGRGSWHAFVAASDDVAYKAFDYTADFHSRDLDGEAPDDNDCICIDLGVMGHDFWRMQPDGFGDFSVGFTSDMDHNAKYFLNHKWRPDMYAEFRKEGKSSISSKLEDESTNEIMNKAASAVLNCAVSELSAETREKIVGMMQVGEDETVVCEGNVIRKIKKEALP